MMAAGEAMEVHQGHAVVAWLWTVGAWMVRPVIIIVVYLALAIWFILRTLYRPLAFLALPFVYLVRFVLACLVFPFTAAAKLETIYIFLGVAALVGFFGGFVVRSVYSLLHKILRLDARPEPKLRSAKQYRQEKKRQKMQVEMPLSARHLSPGPISPGSLSLSDSTRKGKHRRGLLEQTIMEEDDSEF